MIKVDRFNIEKACLLNNELIDYLEKELNKLKESESEVSVQKTAKIANILANVVNLISKLSKLQIEQDNLYIEDTSAEDIRIIESFFMNNQKIDNNGI